jgi:hypothetical protein
MGPKIPEWTQNPGTGTLPVGVSGRDVLWVSGRRGAGAPGELMGGAFPLLSYAFR